MQIMPMEIACVSRRLAAEVGVFPLSIFFGIGYNYGRER
jgi:hypothetical protein